MSLSAHQLAETLEASLENGLRDVLRTLRYIKMFHTIILIVQQALPALALHLGSCCGTLCIAAEAMAVYSGGCQFPPAAASSLAEALRS